jgi:hypothetical protein
MMLTSKKRPPATRPSGVGAIHGRLVIPHEPLDAVGEGQDDDGLVAAGDGPARHADRHGLAGILRILRRQHNVRREATSSSQ